MKKINQFALGFAIALTGAVGFTACSSEENMDVNPSYNKQTGELNVDFVFNISTSNTPTTRMTSANTQATTGDYFRGLTNAYLATFKLNADGKAVTSNTTPIDKTYSFGTILSAGSLTETPDDDLPTSRRVVELSLETATNTMMFWGKAIKTGSDNEQGKIIMNIDEENLANTSFSLCKIVPDVPYSTETSHIYKDALLQHEKLMAAALTRIIRSAIAGKTVTYGGQSVDIDVLNWSDYVKVSGEAGSYTITPKTVSPVNTTGGEQGISPLGEKLAKAFATLNTIHTNELRAGYGEAVAKMMADLMSVINSVVGAVPVSLHETVTQEVAKAIKTNVEYFFDADMGYIWKSVDDVKEHLPAVTGVDAVLSSCNLNEFPKTFNLPYGSVLLQFDIESDATASSGYKFTYNYKGAVETYAMGGSHHRMLSTP